MPSTWGQRQQYGEFKIVGAAEGRPKLLGEGSFGKTFEALRSDSVAGNVIEEHVALKVLDPELLNSESKRVQFVREHTALTRLKHANLVHCIKCGEDNGEVYFAMELCMGGDLAKLVKRFGALPERVVALIGLQAASGLREMHRREMIHRDIKPPNVMLFEGLSPECTLDDLTLLLEENDSLCRIVDFGLVGVILSNPDDADPAVAQKFVGSMMYASPEQILRRKNIDGRTDIYALGMTLWYLLQGRGPLLDARGDELHHATEAEGRHLATGEHEPDLPNNLSQEFRAILARMVAKRPEERVPSAKELVAILERYLERTARTRSVALAPVQSREGLHAFFNFTEDTLKSIGRQRFAAENRSTKQIARLTIVEDLDEIEKIRPDFNEVVKKVFALAQLLRQTGVPPTVLPVHDVVWAADALAYAEDMPGDVTLAEVLQARTASKRPFSFREAEVIFRPIAEALDYLINRGWEFISLPCEDVWLSDPAVAAEPHDKNILCRPLDEWPGLRVTFSGMWVPPARSSTTGSETSFLSTTSWGSSSFPTTVSLRPPVAAFLRLVYRTLNGSDLPDAADRWQSGYIPTISLQAASNNLIRDLLCKHREWSSVSLILNELCANEGVPVRVPARSRSRDSSASSMRSATSKPIIGTTKIPTRNVTYDFPCTEQALSHLPTHPAAGSTSMPPSGVDEEGPSPREAREARACEIISPGLVRLGDHLQEVPALEWVGEGKEFIKCEQTGVWYFFPPEGRGMFAGKVGRLKHVVSPYSGEEQEVEWSQWSPGQEVTCVRTGHAFVLPDELPLPTSTLPTKMLPTGILVPDAAGQVISAFDRHGSPVLVAPADWVPGARVICPTTGHAFVLPASLPPLAAVVDLRKVGWVSSPYAPEVPWTIPPTEWFARREVICPATRNRLVLPSEVEQWVADVIVLDAGAREVRSPYHADACCIVLAAEWRRGGSIKCPPSGRPARLPVDLPLLVGQVVSGTPGVIRSPLSGEMIAVPYPNWITGREVVCKKSGQPFLLPPGLPIPEGSVVEGKPGLAFSPYDRSRSVKVEQQDWRTGRVFTCPSTGASFSLPEGLPAFENTDQALPVAIIVSAARREVRSPHAIHETQLIPKAKWRPAMRIRCLETDEFFKLSDELPLVQGGKIAISYRRLDSKPVVMRFYDDVLMPKFGETNVFIDLDSIAPGENFRRRILTAFQESAVVLVFIGRQWLGVGLGKGGRPRLHEEDDFVRMEVALALELGCTIIPVLIDHTPMPSTDELPLDVRGIRGLQAFELDSGIRCKKDSAALGEEIKRLLADRGVSG